ncbi:MAG: SDR family oxidoreductase [Balneolales bacterium]
MRVSILGCGWLGFPLAERLISEDFLVHGSTATKDKIALLEPAGITPFWITMNPELSGDDVQVFLNTDILVINIPPGRRREDVREFHVAQIRNLIVQIEKSSVGHVIFVSSTSVYPKTSSTVTEEDAENPERRSGLALLEAEQMLLNSTHFDTTVLRFGGLYGPERPLGRFLAGKKNLPNGSAPVNMIHREDCIEIILQLIQKNVRGEIFNACCDQHPVRKELYPKAAASLGLEAPEFQDDDHRTNKTVSSEKLKAALGYHFKHSL